MPHEGVLETSTENISAQNHDLLATLKSYVGGSARQAKYVQLGASADGLPVPSSSMLLLDFCLCTVGEVLRKP